jgi:hypothetical protein
MKRRKTMKTNFRIIFVLSIGVLLVSACSGLVAQAKGSDPANSKPLLGPGSKLGNMVITKGADDAVPLSAFCYRTSESENEITLNCLEASSPRLAVGSTFGLMDLMPASIDLSDLTWEMYLDEQPVNLSAFGTQNIVYADMLPKPSLVREVFLYMTVWDIVLEDPTPGGHTIRGIARVGNEEYRWVVNFIVGPGPLP